MSKESKINILIEKDDNLSRYFVEISKFKKLSREEENELFIRYKNGEKHLKEVIIKHNLRFVVNIAKTYQQRNSKIKLTDLISAGNMGLTVSVDKFNHNSGNKFITYSVWWIRNFILQTLERYKETVKLPIEVLRKQKEIRNFINEYYSDFGEEPNRFIISKELNIELNSLDNYMSNLVVESINGDNNLDDDSYEKTYKELTVYDNHKDEQNHLIHVFNEILPILNERERNVIEYFFGLNKKEALTYTQISERLKLGEETVRQVKTNALKKLRHNIKMNKNVELF